MDAVVDGIATSFPGGAEAARQAVLFHNSNAVAVPCKVGGCREPCYSCSNDNDVLFHVTTSKHLVSCIVPYSIQMRRNVGKVVRMRVLPTITNDASIIQ
jgi:hypothetical protein